MERDVPAERRRIALPRTLGVAAALVPILIAFDALGQEAWPLGLAVLIHAGLAVPLVVALALAWVRPSWGVPAYVILGAVYGALVLGRSGLGPALAVSLPLFLIAALFRRSGRLLGGAG